MNQTQIKGVEVRRLEPDFFHTIYEDNFLLNATHLENMRKLYTELYGDEDTSDLKLLVEFKGNIEISQDISERYIGERIRRKIGEALVSDHPRTVEFLEGASALMGPHPVKVFSNIEDAKSWLQSL